MNPFFLQFQQEVCLMIPKERKQNLTRERELLFYLRLIVPSFLSRLLTHPAHDIYQVYLTYILLSFVRSLDTTYETAVYVHTQIFTSS